MSLIAVATVVCGRSGGAKSRARIGPGVRRWFGFRHATGRCSRSATGSVIAIAADDDRIPGVRCLRFFAVRPTDGALTLRSPNRARTNGPRVTGAPIHRSTAGRGHREEARVSKRSEGLRAVRGERPGRPRCGYPNVSDFSLTDCRFFRGVCHARRMRGTLRPGRIRSEARSLETALGFVLFVRGWAISPVLVSDARLFLFG